MAILSANSRRSPTATAESSPTSERPNPIDSPRAINFDVSPTTESKGHDVDNRTEKKNSTEESDVRERNVYSFRYKTEVNISPEETLDSSEREEARVPSDLDEASLKNEPTRDRARSCSRGNGSEEIQETDTSEDARKPDEAHLDEPVPMEKIEEETEEIITRCRYEERITIKEETLFVQNFEPERNIESYSTSATSCNEEDYSSINKETDVPEANKVKMTRKIEEKRIDEEISETEKESKERIDQETSASLQKLRRVFRGDSRDSGIGDCISNLSSSSQQVNELGISSIKEEETDNDNNNGNARSVSKKVEQFESRKIFMEKMTDNEMTQENSDVSDPKKCTKGSIEVDTLSDVTKINRQHEGVFSVQFVIFAKIYIKHANFHIH